MKHQSHWLDAFSRREAFAHIARATLGVGLMPAVSRQLDAAAGATPARAKNII